MTLSPVREGGDDKPWSVSKVLVAVLELRVTDVCKTVTLLVIPSGETYLLTALQSPLLIVSSGETYF